MGSGADVRGDIAIVFPGDSSPDGDGSGVWHITGGGDGELGAGEIGGDFAGGRGLTGWCDSVGKEEVVDDTVDEGADDEVNNDPLPAGAFFGVVHGLT